MKKLSQFRQKAIHQTPTPNNLNLQQKSIRQSQSNGNKKLIEGGSEQKRQRDNRANAHKQKYTRVKSKNQELQSPLKFGKSLIYKSIKHAKEQENEQIYQKTKDLKLADYLTLYSMSKKSQSSQTKSKIKIKSQVNEIDYGLKQNNKKNNFHTLLPTNENGHSNKASPQKLRLNQSSPNYDRTHKTYLKQNSKLTFAIDTQTSIKAVKQQTKKSLLNTKRDLQQFLQKINHSDDIKSDEQSLVFMCNVLHIFQDKITQSVKLAQQLIEERKKEKNLITDKSPFGNSIMRKGRKSKNKSQISEPSQFTIKPLETK